jgi:hypothetical protein
MLHAGVQASAVVGQRIDHLDRRAVFLAPRDETVRLGLDTAGPTAWDQLLRRGIAAGHAEDDFAMLTRFVERSETRGVDEEGRGSILREALRPGP